MQGVEEEEEQHVHYHGVNAAERHLRVGEALRMLLREIKPVGREKVDLGSALGRILFDDLTSPVDIPKLARSTRDGFAVNTGQNRSAKPDGSGINHRFRLVGDVGIGALPKLIIAEREAVSIATGSYLPRGANAVVMKEYASIQDGKVTVDKKILPGENILKPGEDIAKGETLIRRGVRLEPSHVALLVLVGLKKVDVFRTPRVAFLSTGDELVDVDHENRKGKRSESESGKIFDINRPFVRAMLKELNAEPIDLGIVPDDFRKTRTKLRFALPRCDGLFISAGSSVGERDYALRAAQSIRGVRLLVHGVAMRPSSPTGLAVYNKRPLILLPGFPTSAIVSFLVFGSPAVLKLSGSSSVEYPMLRAKLVEDYTPKRGLTQFLRVRVFRRGRKYQASIIRPDEAYYTKWLGTANAIAVIDESRGAKISRGEEVDVFLLSDVDA